MEKKLIYVHDLNFVKSHDAVYSSSGMPERYFDRFLESGFNIVTIVSRCADLSNCNIKGYTVIDNKNIRMFNGSVSKYSQMFNVVYIYRLIKEMRKSDVLVVNTPSINGFFVLFINVMIRKPYITDVAADYDQFESKKFGKFVSFFAKPLMKHFIRNANGASYVSNYLCRKFPCRSTTLVSSNVNIDLVMEPKTRLVSFDKGAPIKISFVGAMNERKGLLDLLKAVKLLIDDGYDQIELYLVGGHDDRDWNSIVISMGIANNVTFLGLCDAGRVKEILRTSDLYVQPSITEGIPRATIEAMSHGIPVVATLLPGFEEILAPSVLVEPNNYLGLAEKLKAIMGDVHYYNEMAEYNVNKAEMFKYNRLQRLRVEFMSAINLD